MRKNHNSAKEPNSLATFHMCPVVHISRTSAEERKSRTKTQWALDHLFEIVLHTFVFIVVRRTRVVSLFIFISGTQLQLTLPLPTLGTTLTPHFSQVRRQRINVVHCLGVPLVLESCRILASTIKDITASPREDVFVVLAPLDEAASLGP